MTDGHNRFLGNRALSPETLMMGYGYDPFLPERSLKPSVFDTSTFVFRSAQSIFRPQMTRNGRPF
jgi:methionine-gamma-lyase